MCGSRYLTQVQNAQDDDANTQAVLEQILGNQMHLAHNINKLMSLESAVYQ
jgi:DNA-binding transcriptional regulator YbjK